MAGHTDDAGGALEALADVGRVRQLLDQAELGAVRTARRHGKSWAEIAVRLGVTRQSAWERWRDLDETTGATPATAGSPGAADVDEHVASATPPGKPPAAIISRAAGELRRRGGVVVPNVLGMACEDAFAQLRDEGLSPHGLGLDGVPLPDEDLQDKVVADQSPESGAKVPFGAPVSLWLRPGGGPAGVREPRRPKPDPRKAREQRPEPSNEAVG